MLHESHFKYVSMNIEEFLAKTSSSIIDSVGQFVHSFVRNQFFLILFLCAALTMLGINTQAKKY